MAVIATAETSSLASPLVACDSQQQSQQQQEQHNEPHEEETSAPDVPPEVSAADKPDHEEGEAMGRTWLQILGVDNLARLAHWDAEKYEHWQAALRPWSEFLQVSWPQSPKDAVARFRSNTTTYWANYGLVLAVCLAASVVMSPVTMIVMALLAMIFNRKSSVGRSGALLQTAAVIGAVMLAVALAGTVATSSGPALLAHSLLHPRADKTPEGESGAAAREVAISPDAPATAV